MTATTKTAINLFELGYRCRAGIEPNTLIARNPDGVRYVVNPVADSCSCPWGTRADGQARTGKACKHLRMETLRALVLNQWSAVLPASTTANEARYEDSMYDLICAWDAIERALAGMNRVLAAAAPASLVEAATGEDGWARLSNVSKKQLGNFHDRQAA
jgi:hypothetical protein